MARIEIDRVRKRYQAERIVDLPGGRERPALNGVSLRLAQGETVSVVGSSGCGKSTLLKVVAGLEYPDEGRVLYNDHDVTYVRPQERGVGMVFQDYALYPSMKGKGNLAYYFEVHDRTEEEAERRVRETADRMGVGFETLLGRVPTTLSGGEQQRVAIARCIVREPQLFLMDEPISNLDAKLRERTRVEIRKLLRKFTITTLYVTHDQQEAVFMGDRIAVMRDGDIEQVGTFDELYSTPANLFVATFIGSPPMAVIPATIERGEVVVPGGTWRLPPDLAGKLPAGPVRAGVRPEGWILDAPDGVPMPVRHRERIPTERATFLYGHLGEANVAVTAPIDHPDRSEVAITPDWERVYFFAAQSEEPLHVPGVLELF
ncbi:ABC transporter ATP-binding protein [Actinopolymorpha pittospori]|uniref:ABC-type sugar transport system ATPase subunit n=1 Tax=Actinopolymorpha pittospori TaxID=648752 RepID=A0A927RQ12_9ACTN|nr:ABC transporter ATP-binding protein [Actinopolymorpha pittospori]MBE1611733.1 ABC-type sugar transport system ATPase subunit [Actinopolymorpha pittospori]